VHMTTQYDAKNADALRRLVAQGAQLRAFSRPIMQACYKAAFELYDELAAKSAHWKRIYGPWRAFRDDQYLWFRVAENTFDNFVYAQSAAAGRKPAARAKK
jgi:TRAP-type mannitol/chloroaromatic compound transport system substrate-binding protein